MLRSMNKVDKIVSISDTLRSTDVIFNSLTDSVTCAAVCGPLRRREMSDALRIVSMNSTSMSCARYHVPPVTSSAGFSSYSMNTFLFLPCKSRS